MLKTEEVTMDDIRQANQSNYAKTPEILATLSMILWVYIATTSNEVSLLYGSYGTLFFGVICTIVAHKKNRSMIVWFALGAWFAILSFIILLCLQRKPETICQFCQKEISTKATTCPYCRNTIKD